jgi:DNA replication and repair protein RecF
VFEFLAGLFEFTHGFTDAAGEFRNFFGSEQEQNHKEDYETLGSEQTGDVGQESMHGVRIRVLRGDATREFTGKSRADDFGQHPSVPGSLEKQMKMAWWHFICREDSIVPAVFPHLACIGWAGGGRLLPMVRGLRLMDFRCFRSLAIEVPPGGAIFDGDNAQGKTSILEALCVLLRLHSPRTRKMAAMVRHGSPGFGIAGEAWGMERQVRYGAGGVSMRVDGADCGGKGEYLEEGGLVVWMGNEDLELVRGPGEVRRHYLDFIGTQLDPAYRRALGRYRKALRAKNMLLKDSRPRLREIASYEEILIVEGTVLARVRHDLVSALMPMAAAAQAAVSGGREMLALVYEPASGGDLREAIGQAREKELRMRQSIVGPHRDDMRLSVDGVSASEFASEGQQRTLALALKLAQGRLLEERGARLPVYLMDDIFGELDPGRRNALMGFLPSQAQKWISTTHLNWMTETPEVSGLARFTVAGGGVS